MSGSLEIILVYFFEDYKLLYKYLLITLIIISLYLYFKKDVAKFFKSFYIYNTT